MEGKSEIRAVLLVGEIDSYLGAVAMFLSRRDVPARLVCNKAELEASLSELEPHLVIFDHIQPTDLYELNPRQFGFEGPVLILTDDPNPKTALEVLETVHFLQKPTLLTAIWQWLDDLTPERDDPRATV
jgi:hypothetical protein